MAVGLEMELNWLEAVLGPLETDHAPVPTEGAFAVNVVPPIAQIVWFEPAFEAVGFWLNVTTTSSDEATQGALEIVQRSV